MVLESEYRYLQLYWCIGYKLFYDVIKCHRRMICEGQ